jgi:hypothetical protein
MKLLLVGEEYEVKKKELAELNETIDLDYRKEEIVEIIEIALENIDLSIEYTMDMFFVAGYNLIDENDVQNIMCWAKKLKIAS